METTLNLQEIYAQMGIEEPVFTYGEKIANELEPRFANHS